ncbi:hypothetical protein, partial [Acetobacter pasteurianus]|uniref:hypothetical protein n=1 Tax=Acetobacter pasteurianus TaxID=438 RepID=UPI001BDD7758
MLKEVRVDFQKRATQFSGKSFPQPIKWPPAFTQREGIIDCQSFNEVSCLTVGFSFNADFSHLR